MELAVDLLEALARHVGVDLGGANAGVTKQFLDDGRSAPCSSRWVAKL